jgi:hypothetical protein
MHCVRHYCLSSSDRHLASAERDWQMIALSTLNIERQEHHHQVSSSVHVSSPSPLIFQEGSAFYLNGATWLYALINLTPMLAVSERQHIFKYSLYLADMLARRTWLSVDKLQWLDSKSHILLIWEWACDAMGSLLAISRSETPACSAIIHLVNSVTRRDADSSNIRLECLVDLIRKFSAFKSTWQSGCGYSLLAKLLTLASAASEPLRIIEIHHAVACTYSMLPCCHQCESKKIRSSCLSVLKHNCCDAATADICARLCSINATSLTVSLSHIRSSVYSIYHMACARVAIILPFLLNGQGIPFLAPSVFECETLRAKITDIFTNSQFPETVLKLRQFIEGLKPKWNGSVQHDCNHNQLSSSSSVPLSAEFRSPAKNAPATVGEQAAFFSCNGDVDGLAFNSFLLMLIIFEGSHHFGNGNVASGSNNCDKEKHDSSGFNFSSYSHLPSFAQTIHASSVIAAVLRSFRFRGGIDKRSCSLTAELIPRVVFLWLCGDPCIPFSFVGTSYDPTKCAAALICCVAKGLISFGSFTVWLLYPALVHMSKCDRTKECRRMLTLASRHKQKHPYLDLESSQNISLAIENAAKHETSVQFWLELIRIVSDSKIGGKHSGSVTDWDARTVRDMLNDVALTDDIMLDFSAEKTLASGACVSVNNGQKNIVANQIAQIMIDISLNGPSSDTNHVSTNSMHHLSSLFHAHVLACATCDPFDEFQDDSSSSEFSKASQSDIFISTKLQELRMAVSSYTLSDALIFAESYGHDDLGSASGNANTGPSLQTLIAMHYTSPVFISRVSKFFIAAVEIGLVLIGSGTVPSFAAAVILRKLCPTLTSRYFNHMLLLVSSADIPNSSCKTPSSHDHCHPLFAPLDHALPLLHHCACSHNFCTWAKLSSSHAASALREKVAGCSTTTTSSDFCSAFDSKDDAVSNIANHCSSITVSAFLRTLHLELGLGAIIRSEKVGEHVCAQQHELISLLHTRICQSAISRGGDESIMNGCCSSVSLWRCEAFRDLNCSFMELGCSPSLILTSLGVIASRISACDAIFESVTTITLQQTTLHATPTSTSGILSDDQAHFEHPHNGYLHQHVRNKIQRVDEDEDVSLTDDERDDVFQEDIPGGVTGHDSQSGSRQQLVGASMYSDLCVLPDFSHDACWSKLHDALLLLPTAVRRLPLPERFCL